MQKRTVVLISGSGSNLQAILDDCARADSPAKVVAVISNRPGAFGLQRAANAGVASRVVDHTGFDSRADFDARLRAEITGFEPDLVVLAGFMRILTPAFVQHFEGKMLNIHPSLLPNYPGLHTHRRALAAGDKYHGATVHFVTAELDGGPAIVHAVVPVVEGDDEVTLAARVLVEEHRLYPLAVRWCATEKARLVNGQTWIDNEPAPPGGICIDAPSAQ